MHSFAQEIKGKKVLVFGLGRQGGGQGDADWLTQQGAVVKVSDRDLSLVPEGQNQADIDWADLIIKNPGVADDHPLIEYAKSQGKPVETSIAVFVKHSPIPVIGITGTRGKSTTTALITQILEQAFPGQIITGGNIPGTSGLRLFEQVEGKKYAVLELSSFQLHSFHDLHVSPHIAVVTNLYPDHLNRYASMDAYRRDKEAIVAYQKAGDLTFINANNPGSLEIGKAAKGKVITFNTQEVEDWPTTLLGEHNRENIAAAWAVAKSLGVTEMMTKQVVQDFHGLSHRLETVREVNGVSYINDTTATTPTAATKALMAVKSPIIWMTGGDTKNLPFTELLQEVKDNQHIKHIIILGSKNIAEYTTQLKSLAGDKIISQTDSIVEAVGTAQDHAQPGDVVLLSPGFTSFDLFQNEFDRGDQFSAAVKNL